MNVGRLLRIGALTLGAVAAATVVGVLGWFVYTQMPCKEARELEALRADRTRVPDVDNAYLDAFGFNAPPGEDAHARGAVCIDWIQRKHRHSDQADKVGKNPCKNGIDLASRTDSGTRILEACRAGTARACAEAVFAVDAQPLNAHEELLLSRYQGLLSRKAWFESLPLDVEDSVPALGGIIEAQRVHLLRLRWAAARGETAGLRDQLERDLCFWRMLLRSSDTLIAKMVAVAAIRNHFVFANLILRALPADQAREAVPPSWRLALRDDERSMWPVMANEYVFVTSLIRKAERDESPILDQEDADDVPTQLLDKIARRVAPPRMLNQRAKVLHAVARAFDVPLDHYLQAREGVIAEHGAEDGGGMAMYGLRVGSVEGMRRAALLVVELRGRGVPVEEVTAELARSDLRRPFDGQPFLWKDAEHAVIHEGPERKRPAIALYY